MARVNLVDLMVKYWVRDPEYRGNIATARMRKAPELEKIKQIKKERGPEYFKMIGKVGGKSLASQTDMAARGRLGGLKTKTVKRKPYVKGKSHGNTGKKYNIKRQRTHPFSMSKLIKEVEYKLQNPGAYTPLTWEPGGWKPGVVPKDVPVYDSRGNLLFERMPQPGEDENTK